MSDRFGEKQQRNFTVPKKNKVQFNSQMFSVNNGSKLIGTHSVTILKDYTSQEGDFFLEELTLNT